MLEREDADKQPADISARAAEIAVASTVPGLRLDAAGVISLQRHSGNRATARLLMQRGAAALARQEAGDASLPQPDRSDAHRRAFDAFVDEMNTAAGADDQARLARLKAMREKVDVPLAAGTTTTLRLPGHALVVDRRNLTAVMTRLRWRAMDIIHEKVTAHRARETSATTAAAKTTVRTELAAAVKPFLDYLQGPINDPESARTRYEHWYDVVQASVLYALQSTAVVAAQTVGLKADGSGMTRTELAKQVGRMGSEPWCGAFADVAYREARLLGPAAGAAQLDGEKGVLEFMRYGDAISTGQEISVGDRTVAVKDYHGERRSWRRTQIIANRPDAQGHVPPPAFTVPGAEYVQVGEVDIQPGDILLWDNAKGARPDHIMVATAYDASSQQVSKIAGNEVTKEGQVAVGTFGLRDQPDQISLADHQRYEQLAALREAKERARKAGTEFTDAAKLTSVEADISTYEASHPEFYEAPSKKRSRLAAVCRFSIVDFEPHAYVSKRARKALARTPARQLARVASEEVALADELVPLLDDDAKAPQAIARLDGLWIQYTVFVLKLLVERGKGDRLAKFAAARPRVQAALATVLNPAGAKNGTVLTGLIPDQQAQLRGFARRREWPTAIPVKGAPRPADLDDPLGELAGIVAAVRHERRAVEDTMSGAWVAPTPKNPRDPTSPAGMGAEQVEAMTLADQRAKFKPNLLGGYMKTAASDPRDPTSYAARGAVPADDRPRVEAVNRIVWEELGHEGDVGSINTYDNAVLTWGKGWAGSGGRLPSLMRQLPQAIKDRLLDLGVAYDNGWLALDVGNKAVLKGMDALQYVRFDKAILSAMYALGQGASAQALVDAQANVMFDEFDRMPKAIRDLDDRLIMVIVHCCWWGHMTPGQAVALVGGQATTADRLRAVVRWQASRGGCHTDEQEGATIVDGWQANLFHKMGRGFIAATFTERAAAPTAAHAGKTLIRPAGMQYIVV